MQEDTNSRPAPTEMSATAIAGFVIGILAFILAWIPIVNNAAFFIAIVGLVFAIIGTVATARKVKRGTALAIVGLIICVLSIVIVLITQNIYGAAIDSVTEPEEVTSVSGQKDGQETDVLNLSVGEAVTLDNGLKICVKNAKTVKDSSGDTCTCIKVTYTNTGNKDQSYNSYDWQGQDKNGAQDSQTLFMDSNYKTDKNELGSGTLSAGGKASGTIYFDGKIAKALYYDNSLFDDAATAGWSVK